MRHEAHKHIASPLSLHEKQMRIPHASCLMPHASRRRRGFTLIEMIVATMLLALAVVGALVAYHSATLSAAHSERMHTVSLLAQRRLTELELQADTLSGGEQQGDFAPEYPEYAWQQ